MSQAPTSGSEDPRPVGPNPGTKDPNATTTGGGTDVGTGVEGPGGEDVGTATGTSPPPGHVATDYTGSYDEWYNRVVSSLVERYVKGEGGSGWAKEGFNSPYGAPDPNDFNNPDEPVSWQTINFAEEFVKNEGESSTWIQENFGAPPEEGATYIPDPNSQSVLQEDQQEFEEEQARKEREAATERAEIGAEATVESAEISAEASRYTADKALERTQMEIDNAWKTAKMEDATRRYIAEGEWGLQKWVTEENNQASKERLQMQLDMREDELAQQAKEAEQLHQREMQNLALEVAKYDSELAASPRNWLKYAGWLRNRDQVVNGMTLAMASQEVPEESIDPSEVSESTGNNVAALQAAQEQQISGQSGGSLQEMSADELNQMLSGQFQDMAQSGQTMQDILGQGNVEPGSTGAFSQQQQGQQGGGQLPQQEGTPSAQDLENMDPAQLAQDLLGRNPMAGQSQQAQTQNLQQIAEGLGTSGQDVAAFGAYGGPTENALGVDVGEEVSGQKSDFREFSDLLPSEQQAKMGLVESVRGEAGVEDYTEEMLRSRPKGRASGRGGTKFG